MPVTTLTRSVKAGVLLPCNLAIYWRQIPNELSGYKDVASGFP